MTAVVAALGARRAARARKADEQGDTFVAVRPGVRLVLDYAAAEFYIDIAHDAGFADVWRTVALLRDLGWDAIDPRMGDVDVFADGTTRLHVERV